jgi:hypothetical protein
VNNAGGLAKVTRAYHVPVVDLGEVRTRYARRSRFPNPGHTAGRTEMTSEDTQRQSSKH